MQQRSDPLIPILGSAVSLVVIGAILLVFVPRVSDWFEERSDSVVKALPDPDRAIPLWTCESQPGVAMLIEPLTLTGDGKDAVLDRMLVGGPYRYYRLRVYNFEGKEPVRVDLASGDAATSGFDSPEGGVRLVPAAGSISPAADLRARTVLAGLGATSTLAVPPGESGQILLIASADLSARTGFSRGTLQFQRKEKARSAIASWHEQPTLKQFSDF
jgi:hypothetical protein